MTSSTRSASRRPAQPGNPQAPSSVIHHSDDPIATAILDAAVATMAAKGYHGTSVRDIATVAGVASGSIYTHFGSKHDLLMLIMNRGMDGLIACTEDALFHAGTDPADRLRAIVGAHVRVHVSGLRESLLGNSELRSLDPSARELIVSKRDTQRRMFDRVIVDGVDRGAFHTADPIAASRFIVTACTAVATWYRPDGPMGAEEIIESHQRIALDTVGHHDPSAAR
ncbi:TetR/AcrR family transcriptional regulator [Gordonia sp. NPDC003376]